MSKIEAWAIVVVTLVLPLTFVLYLLWKRWKRRKRTTFSGGSAIITVQNSSGVIDQEEEDIRKQNLTKRRYTLLSLVGVGLVILSAFALSFVGEVGSVPSLLFGKVSISGTHISFLVSALLIWYLIKSFTRIFASERAVLIFLGRELFVLDSGPFMVWLWLCTLVYVPGTRQQRQYPEDFANIWLQDGPLPAEGKWVEPFRITTGARKGEKEGETVDPLDGRLTLNTAFLTAWRVTNPLFAVRMMGFSAFREDGTPDPRGRLLLNTGEIHRQLADTSKRALNNYFGSRTAREIIEGQANVAFVLANELDNIVRRGEFRWGIDLEEVALTLCGLSHDLNRSISAVPMARYAADATVVNGAAEAKVMFLKGEQAALIRKLALEAEASGLEAIADKLNLKDTVALQALINAQVASKALENSLKEGGKVVLVGGGGIANILGLLEAYKEKGG